MQHNGMDHIKNKFLSWMIFSRDLKHEILMWDYVSYQISCRCAGNADITDTIACKYMLLFYIYVGSYYQLHVALRKYHTLTQYKIKTEIAEDVSSQLSCMQVTNQWHSCLRRDEICDYFLKDIKQVCLCFLDYDIAQSCRWSPTLQEGCLF